MSAEQTWQNQVIFLGRLPATYKAPPGLGGVLSFWRNVRTISNAIFRRTNEILACGFAQVAHKIEQRFPKPFLETGLKINVIFAFKLSVGK